VAEPIIFVVDPDSEALAWMGAALQRRFGADYRIMTDDASSSAIGRLEQACRDGEDVVLVIAAVASYEYLDKVG